MKKIKLNIVPAIDTSDIIDFISENSKKEFNNCCEIFSQELNHIIYKLPDQIEMIDEYRISKVIVDKLKYEGWIKKFTETQELLSDYYILFTD